MSEIDVPINRRELLASSLATGAASVLFPKLAGAADNELTIRIVDTNVNLFEWPFRRLPLDDTDALVQKLRTLGITEAWAGSFEGILHRDVAGVNQRLVEACRRHPELVPIGTVNPMLPDWQEDLRRCFEQHKMPGVRLHPNYHGYTLDAPSVSEIFKRATAAKNFVQIAAAMEDVRTQHPLVQVADVNLAPLAEIVSRHPGSNVQILNIRPHESLLPSMANVPGIYFDTSRIDGTDGLSSILKRLPADRLMLGSHSPFLITEAALIRVHEANLNVPQLRSLLWETAARVKIT